MQRLRLHSGVSFVMKLRLKLRCCGWYVKVAWKVERRFVFKSIIFFEPVQSVLFSYVKCSKYIPYPVILYLALAAAVSRRIIELSYHATGIRLCVVPGSLY